MYHFAGIELAVLGSSNWAALLHSDDIRLLEYAADLKVSVIAIRERILVTSITTHSEHDRSVLGWYGHVVWNDSFYAL